MERKDQGRKEATGLEKKGRTKGQLRQAVGFSPLNLGLKASSWANASRAGLIALALALVSSTPCLPASIWSCN